MSRTAQLIASRVLRPPAAPYSTLTHYLAADGVLDAFAAGAMTAVDDGSRWVALSLWLDYGSVSPAEISWAAVASAVPAHLLRNNASGAGYGPNTYTRDAGGTTYTACGAQGQSGVSLVVQEFDEPNTQHRVIQLSSAGTADSGYDTAPGAALTMTDLNLLAYNGTTIHDAGGLYWWAAVSVVPDAAQMASLRAGAAPWAVLGGANVLRCYMAREAYDSGGTAYLPDVAQDHGGPNAPVDAEIRNGDINDIVEAA